MGCRSAIASSSLPDFPVSGLAGLAGLAGWLVPTLGSNCVAHVGEPHLEARTTIVRASSILTKAWSRDDRQGLVACEARSLSKITFVPSNINGKSWLVVEGSLEVKLPTILTDEKQSREEAERRERVDERRVEEKE